MPATAGSGRQSGSAGRPRGWDLRGAVDPRRLRAVLEGRHPASGHRLRSERATVLGFDMTFSAPKSVSVVFALGGEDVARDVVAAHRAGVRGAVAYVETHGLAARRGSGERARDGCRRPVSLGASFTHGVSRNLDPHLHTHVVMSNMVHGHRRPVERMRPSWHLGAPERCSAVYEAHLRSELSKRLGVGWVKGPGLQTEIAGVSPLVLGEFSSRSADIRMHMAEWRSHSARGARVAWAATRSRKAPGGSYDELSSAVERVVPAHWASARWASTSVLGSSAARRRTWPASTSTDSAPSCR